MIFGVISPNISKMNVTIITLIRILSDIPLKVVLKIDIKKTFTKVFKNNREIKNFVLLWYILFRIDLECFFFLIIFFNSRFDSEKYAVSVPENRKDKNKRIIKRKILITLYTKELSHKIVFNF